MPPGNTELMRAYACAVGTRLDVAQGSLVLARRTKHENVSSTTSQIVLVNNNRMRSPFKTVSV